MANRLTGKAPPPAELAEAMLDLTPADREIIARAAPYTMTSAARVKALVDATRYCTRRDVPGALVECGVWRGGSVVAMIAALQEADDVSRDIYLFDSFEGMTLPTEHDVSSFGPSALEEWDAAQRAGQQPWAEAYGPEAFSEEVVRATVLATGYPPERIHLVRGPVEETVPEMAPASIALLRLDTDWYESTRHELVHLYPRLVDSGVLILDDYGHWEGCRRAVDEYFEGQPAILLNRIDYTGRIAIKH